ncbi:CU044_2847 family protein [Nodosilinea sp. P-1105]|uniref:CU044_2847 family protein n=1 Tax=Nodosilinea sp. P-1105 TaxID=2546229 RepID=UPI00146CA8E1|nr:CU044_2847 family protein [Nodosilinea sp. P-1105]NMF86790.1 hypothetical protein [Nodosilinea sp. P-1105]
MKKIVEFTLPSGDSVFAEVDEPVEGDGRVGLNPTEMVVKAQQTYEQALDKIQPIASTLISKLRELNEPADEVEVKFGIKLTAEAGAIIALAGGEVNYEITLKWKKAQ